MVRDSNGYLDETWLKATQYLLKVSGTPRNNQAQNEQTRAASKKYKLSKEGEELLHRRVGGQGYGYQEILEEAKEIASMGGKYVK